MLATSTATETPAQAWFPANLAAINQRFDGRHPYETLRWGLATFGDEIAMATGFGASGVALMHMIAQIRPRTTFFYLQTDLLFPETMELRDRLADRLGISFTEVHSGLSLNEQSNRFGPELWRHNPDLCCSMRKVVPLRRFLADKRAWISGIRREQSLTRAHTEVVTWDSANHLVKLNPLAAWTNEQVWTYIREHNLPYNPLHDRGYPSVGCFTCTRAIRPGEHERAGRWAESNKLECGIHIQPNGQIARLAVHVN